MATIVSQHDARAWTQNQQQVAMLTHSQKPFTEQNQLAQWGVTHFSYWTLSKHTVWLILGDRAELQSHQTVYF
jgi:hypothetical protein